MRLRSAGFSVHVRPPPGPATPAGPQHAGGRAPRGPFNGSSPAPAIDSGFRLVGRAGGGTPGPGPELRAGRGPSRPPPPLSVRQCARVGGVRAGTVLSARCHPAPAAARWREGARGPSPREPPPAAGDPPPAPASMSPPATAAPSVCSARASRRRLGHWPPDPRP